MDTNVIVRVVTDQINKIKKQLREFSKEFKEIRTILTGFEQRLATLENILSEADLTDIKLPNDLQLERILLIIKELYDDGLIDEFDDVIVVDVYDIAQHGGWKSLQPSDVIACLRRNRKLKKVPPFVKGDGKIALSIEEVW